jgi:hypothetical protein
MASNLDVGPAWQPRSIAQLSQLQLGLVGNEFDFAGVLLWAGEVIASEYTTLVRCCLASL